MHSLQLQVRNYLMHFYVVVERLTSPVHPPTGMHKWTIAVLQSSILDNEQPEWGSGRTKSKSSALVEWKWTGRMNSQATVFVVVRIRIVFVVQQLHLH